jgi:hypothetical protein
MAYTRWLCSNWYSFYNTIGINTTKEQQVLSLWHVSESKSFTYEELRSFGEYKLRTLYPLANDVDINEGLDIIALFMFDVEKDFADDDLK